MTLPMPHRLLPFADHAVECFFTGLLTLASMVGALLAESSANPSDEVRLMLMPAVGAFVAVLAMMCFSPVTETRQSLAGRSILSVLFGAGTPVVVGFFSDYGKTLAQHPVGLLIAGSVIAIIVFPNSRPLASRLYQRSDAIAESVVDNIEDAIPGGRRTDGEDDTSTLKTPRRR